MEVSKITCGSNFFPGSYSPFKMIKDAKAYPKGYSVNLGLDKEPTLILKAITIKCSLPPQIHTNPLQEIVMPEGDTTLNLGLQHYKKLVKIQLFLLY